MTMTAVCEPGERLRPTRPRNLFAILFPLKLAQLSIGMLASIGVALVAMPVFASSYYTSRPEDARAVYLTSAYFPVKGDGIADDSAALQQAIDRVQEKTNHGLLFIPSGRYRISRTIYIWPGIRLIGFGPTRPVFVLADNTPGFQQDPAYMFFFAGARPRGNEPPPDANLDRLSKK
jgi:hypothetical protein